MPRKRSNGRRATTEVEWGGFIDVRLSQADKAAFGEWVRSFDMSMLDDIMAEGIKVGISWDGEGETYLCAFTSETHAGENLRCVLTGRAAVWEQAVALTCFKHLEMLAGDWGRYRPQSGRVAEI